MTDPTHRSDERVPISLVLGGGGAKGIAHIGVFKAIEKHNLQIQSIVGTSIGAFWGALFLNSLRLLKDDAEKQKNAIEFLEQIALRLRFKQYRDWAFRRMLTKGFLEGKKLTDWLSTLLWDTSTQKTLTFGGSAFFDLLITATDALTGESILFDALETPAVPIAMAVRASLSIQGVFEEISIDLPGKPATRFWDGGTTGNCRFDIALRRNPCPVVSSSLTYRGEPVDIDKGVVRALFRIRRIREHSFNILLRQAESLIKENISSADRSRLLALEVPLSGITTFDFDIDNVRKQQAIDQATAFADAEIKKFRKSVGF